MQLIRDAVRPELTFYEPFTAASDTTATVEITTDDGSIWTPLSTSTSANNRSDWILRRISLDGYRGETVRIRFRGVQGDAWTSDVWIIDDVRIGEREALPDLGFPFTDDMESGDSGWEPNGQWVLVDDDAHSPEHAWSMNPGDEYQQNTNFGLELALMIEIPAEAMRPELTYFDHFDIASDTTLSVEATLDDGETWEAVASFTSAYNRPDWVMRIVPLDAYAGQTIRLRFQVVQGSSWYRDHWLIDDVRINERQPLPDLGFPFEDNLEAGGNNWLPDGQWAMVEGEGYSGSHGLSLNPGRRVPAKHRFPHRT